MTAGRATESGEYATRLPRRVAPQFGPGQSPGADPRGGRNGDLGILLDIPRLDDATHSAVNAELTALRTRVPGVRGALIAGIDGLLVVQDLTDRSEPHDLAALAATIFGLSRQCGQALRHGPFRESTIHSQSGYFTVYAVHETALLAVLGDDGLNVARLHLEARPVIERLADLLHVGGTT